MAHSIVLCEHDPEWAPRAAQEITRLMTAMGPALVRIEHVGSTSIPGLRAKPTIDLLPIASTLTALDAARGAFESLGYEWRGEFGLPQRRFCVLNAADGRRLFNVHCWAQDDPSIARHLAFRDYLRAHPEEAKAYEAVKLRAAAQCGDDMARYTDLKSDWIRACQTRALAG
jgi:GrpB-like predicted nucleotidyltransferase (UPF0157 family)